MARSPGTDTRFRRLYDRNFVPVRNYCLRRLPVSEVNDAVAEVFLVAWRRIDDAPQDEEDRLWLYGVARNVIRNVERSTRRQTRLGNKLRWVGSPPDLGPETLVVRRSEDRRVLAALGGLSPVDQEMLRLSIWEELSNGEIAEVLGIEAHAVTMRLSRARNRLAKKLGISSRPKRTRTDPQPVGEGGEQ